MFIVMARMDEDWTVASIDSIHETKEAAIERCEYIEFRIHPDIETKVFEEIPYEKLYDE